MGHFLAFNEALSGVTPTKSNISYSVVEILLLGLSLTAFSQSGSLPASWQQKELGNTFVRQRSFPEISNGYLSSFLRSLTEPGTGAIHITSLSSPEYREVAFWLDGASAIWPNDVTVTRDQHFIVAGSLLRNGSTFNFIAETDSAGGVLANIDLGNYEPVSACASEDGTIWTLGQDFSAESMGASYALLRHYSTDFTLIDSYISRRDLNFGALDLAAARHSGSQVRTFLRCGAESVGVYIGRTKTWFEVGLDDGMIKMWSVKHLGHSLVTGLALLNKSQVYATFKTPVLGSETPLCRLYKLDLNQGTVASWKSIPVSGPFARLLGSDGDSLVYLPNVPVLPHRPGLLFWSRP